MRNWQDTQPSTGGIAKVGVGWGAQVSTRRSRLKLLYSGEAGGYINVIEISRLGNFKGQAEQASPVEDAMAMSPSRRMGRFLGEFAQDTISLVSVHNATNKARGLVEQYRLEGNVPVIPSF